MLTRHLGVKILIAGKDVTKDLSPYLKSITYSDVESGKTDTVELELQDSERLFMSDWFPKRGDTLEVELIREFWRGEETETLPLGTFEIDEVSNSYPPSACKLKGNSCPQNSELRQVDESKAWENVRLSEIAQDIAAESNCELFFEASDDPDIKRAEQSEHSRLAFLQKLCTDNGLALKFADGKLIIFDEEKLESQEPVATFDRDLSTIKKFSGTATLTEVYKDCQVTYRHGKQAEVFTGTAEDATKTDGKTLKINQRVENQAEAERLARKKLREKNKDEWKISLTVTGDFRLLSGNVIELKNHGVYDGRWLIESARHKVGRGYEVSIDCHKCQ